MYLIRCDGHLMSLKIGHCMIIFVMCFSISWKKNKWDIADMQSVNKLKDNWMSSILPVFFFNINYSRGFKQMN